MVSRLDEPLRAYRIADSRHPIFEGTGAAALGGRWNSPGRRVIYASETYAGALLEKLAHTNIGRVPNSQVYLEIEIPEGMEIEILISASLPDWDQAGQRASRVYGDAWYDEQRSAVLLVPSIITRVERNVVINENHPAFPKIKASTPRPVIWDERLFR